MSSKDKGSSDSLSTKSKKKDKAKKEKKEKKEKSKKRDSKDLETVHDFGEAEKQTEGNGQEPSPKSKTFGLFRLSGRKSKHGSQDSLKRQSRESIDFERSGSEFSLEESAGSVESATAGKPGASEKDALDHKETSERAKGERKAETSNETEVENATLVESLSRPENNSSIQPVLAEDRSFDKTSEERAVTEDTSPKEDSPDDKLQKEDLREPIEEPANNTSPESIKGESFVISETETNKATEDNKERHDQEITSSEGESVDTVVSTGISNTGDVGESTDEHENEKLSEMDIEELIFSTYEERKGPQQDDRQDEQDDETPFDEKAIMLVYPDKRPVQREKKAQEDAEEQEQLVALTVDIKENRVQEQVNELLKLDFEENMEQEGESRVKYVKREGGQEKSSDFEVHTTKISSKGGDIPKDRPKQLVSEISSFDDEPARFTSSTPKRSPTAIAKDTRKETRRGDLRPVEGRIAQTAVKVSSVVEVQLRGYIVKTITEVKISSTVLLAQLVEINKKLRALKWELLKVQESGKVETV